MLWGTLGMFLTLLMGFGLSDVAVSSMGPMIVILFYGIKVLVTNPKAFRIGWKNLLILLLAGGVANALLFFSYTKALSYLSTGVFSILEFSHVFVLMVLSAVIFKYKITKGKLFSLLLAALGLVLVLNVFAPGAFVEPAGLLWMAVNWLCNCGVALVLKWALNAGVDNDVVITVYSFGTALIYWIICPPWLIFGEIAASQNLGMLLLVIAAYGLFTQIVSSYVWVKSFSLVDPAITNMMNALSPVTACIIGFFLFGEKITLLQILGIAVIIGAVLVLNKTADDEPGEAADLPSGNK